MGLPVVPEVNIKSDKSSPSILIANFSALSLLTSLRFAKNCVQGLHEIIGSPARGVNVTIASCDDSNNADSCAGKSLFRKSPSLNTSFAPLRLMISAASTAFMRVLMGTNTAPAICKPIAANIQRAELQPHIATRSPGLTPDAISARQTSRQ